jgi:DNA-binding transcriptional LysR family regulator
LGITYQSQLDVWPDVQAGRLIELFPRHYGESTPLQIVCAHRASITPAIQLLRDFLQSRLWGMIGTDYAIT